MMRVRATGSGWDGAPGLMTWYFTGSTSDLPGASACVDSVRSALQALTGFWNTSTSWQVHNEVDELNPATGQVTATWVFTGGNAAIAGADTGGKGATATAALVRLTTDTFIAGRRVRGRTFISPLAASAVAGTGLIAAGNLAAVTAYGAALLTYSTVRGYFAVWHRPKLGVGGSAAQVVGVAGSSKPAVLRSRRD